MGQNAVALATASAAASAKLQHDKRKAPPALAPVFTYLEHHLYDEALNAGTLFKACGILDHRLRSQFRVSLGVTPFAYIENLRMETAQHLLQRTDLKVQQITQFLGYSRPEVFSRTFRRLFGTSPSAWRASRRQSPANRRSASNQSHSRRSTFQWTGPNNEAILRDVLRGRLQTAEALQLIGFLSKLYSSAQLDRGFGGFAMLREEPPRSQIYRKRQVLRTGLLAVPSSITAVELGLTTELIDQFRAEELWTLLKHRSHEHQLLLVRTVPFKTLALWDLLASKSREVGRDFDRRLGRSIADLTLGAIEGLRDLSEEKEQDLSARSWACIGNARRLSGSALEAKAALRIAGSMSKTHQISASTRAYIYLCMSSLHRDEGLRFKAMKEASGAAVSYKKLGNSEMTAACHLSWFLSLSKRGGPNLEGDNFEHVKRRLLEARELAQSGYLRACSLEALVNLHWRNGRLAEARQALDELMDEPAQDPVYFAWIRGTILESEGKYEEGIRALEEALAILEERHELARAAEIALHLSDLSAAVSQARKSLHWLHVAAGFCAEAGLKGRLSRIRWMLSRSS